MIQIFQTDFSHDWNTREGNKVGKLNCAQFTTLRLHSDKYKPSTLHKITNLELPNNRLVGYAVVVHQVCFQFKNIDKYDILCRLDTGYPSAETATILTSIYKTLTSESWLNFVVMRYLTAKEEKTMHEKIKQESLPTIAFQ